MTSTQDAKSPSATRDAFVASPTSLSALTTAPHDAPASDEPNERLARVLRGFLAAFSSAKPRGSVHVAMAPGRVNLIGEHIDYEGYSVLPMAIAQSMAVAVASSPSSSSSSGLRLRIANTDPNYATASVSLSFPPTEAQANDALFQQLASQLTEETMWVRYVLCGLMVVVEWSPSLLSSHEASMALDVVVDGRIPPACGLSSSSALVVSSALALASYLSKEKLPTRTQLAERCRFAEQYVGTAGGGMDQAVSCLGTRNAALFVTFEPTLRVEQVAFPAAFAREQAVYVVVNSGVEAHKARDAAARFNKRVVECALATKLLGKRLGVRGWEQMTTLSELQRALQEDRGRPVLFDELLGLVARDQDNEEFSLDELTTELSESTPFSSLFAGSRLEKAAKEVLNTESHFKLWQRARHVWSEAGRVEQFRQLLLASSETDGDEQLQQLGALMLASHASCRDDYECSCPELDKIVEVAQKAGAYGARLTGAGWGGCAVVLVRADRVVSLRTALDAVDFEHITPENAIFESTAADGARLFTVS